MSFNLIYGRQLESKFFDSTQAIVRNVKEGNPLEISKKINGAFFSGGVFAPKSFKTLFSAEIPQGPGGTLTDLTGATYVSIGRRTSISAVVSVMEGIPVIGSAIAAIKFLYHLYGMVVSYSSLGKIVKEFKTTDKNDHNTYFLKNKEVFEKALTYTIHQNQLIASFLSLFPMVKPTARIAQGIIYKSQVKRQNTTKITPSENEDSGKILEQLKNILFSSAQELKPLKELVAVHFVATFYTPTESLQNLQKDIIASDTQDICEMLDLSIEEIFAKSKEFLTQNSTDMGIEWSLIGKDSSGLLHGVIGRRALSFNKCEFSGNELKDFFKNVEYKNKDQLTQMMSEKLTFDQHLTIL